MKIAHYFANGCFDWFISGQQSDNLLREAISIPSWKYKKFSFVHSMHWSTIHVGNKKNVCGVLCEARVTPEICHQNNSIRTC